MQLQVQKHMAEEGLRRAEEERHRFETGSKRDRGGKAGCGGRIKDRLRMKRRNALRLNAINSNRIETA